MIWGRKYFPSLTWTLALIALYFMGEGPSLCLFKWIGFDHCPGCGLGRSVHLLLHGSFTESFNAHLLGLPATLAIAYLALQPFYTQAITTKNYGSENVNDAPGSATH
jgi:hypothetical protein